MALRYPDKPALAGPDGKLTFAELEQRTASVAAGLQALGVRHGDQVALWMANCPTWVIVWYACARLGAVLVPINTRYKPDEVAYILKQSDAKTLIMMDQYWGIDYVGMIRDIIPGLAAMQPGDLASTEFPELKAVVVWSDDAPPGMLSLNRVMTGADGATIAAAEAQVSPDDPLIIVYTSGTTGFPKGAVHSHVALRNCANIAKVLHIEHDDVVLGHMPYYHVAGAFAAVLPTLLQGSTLVTVPHWKPNEVLDLIDTEKISILAGIPTHYIDLVDEVRRSGRRPTSLKTGWIGGATVTAEVAMAARQELNMQSLQAVYGMTETTSSTTFSGFNDPIEVLCENKGKPIGDFEVAIFSDEGSRLDVGMIGEVRVRGHIVMLGYYKNELATAEVMTPDGWFKTGDLGSFDEAGYLKITGRKKDMFIVGGSNTYPAEIERVLQSNPVVRQAIVVGVPDRRLGEVGYAFIELEDGKSATTAELNAFCRNAMADYKVPRYFEFVREFEKTSTGKIQRANLAKRAARAATERTRKVAGTA